MAHTAAEERDRGCGSGGTLGVLEAVTVLKDYEIAVETYWMDI